MILLEMKCPQLSKPQATAARNQKPKVLVRLSLRSGEWGLPAQLLLARLRYIYNLYKQAKASWECPLQRRFLLQQRVRPARRTPVLCCPSCRWEHAWHPHGIQQEYDHIYEISSVSWQMCVRSFEDPQSSMMSWVEVCSHQTLMTKCSVNILGVERSKDFNRSVSLNDMFGFGQRAYLCRDIKIISRKKRYWWDACFILRKRCHLCLMTEHGHI